MHRFSWPKPEDHCAGTSTALLFFDGRIDNAEILDGDIDRHDPSALRIGLEALYRDHGKACANMLVGDFAAAFWDPTEKAVVCFRDFCGCQPVYYHVGQDRFSIASSIEGLLSDPDIKQEIDDQFVVPSLTRFFNHPERTSLRGIHKIPPAHILTIRPDSIKREAYWRFADVPAVDYSDPDAVHERFRELVKQAVKDRLPSKGAVGVHASGGIDCSVVAVLAADILKQEGRAAPRAYSWQPDPDANVPAGDGVFRDLDPNVYSRIETVCKAAGLDPLYRPVLSEHYLEIWKRDHTINPIGGATYSEWPVHKDAQAHGVQHILTGFGGDEAASFTGRGYEQSLALRGKWATLFKLAKEAGANPLRRLVSYLKDAVSLLVTPDWVHTYYRTETGEGVARWKVLLRTALRKNRTRFLLNAREQELTVPMFSYLSKAALRTVKPLPLWKTSRPLSVKRAIQDVFEVGILTSRIEAWHNDGAKHGIRYHYPLLDKRVIELVVGLPDHAFRNGTHKRLFYKNAMDPILPKSVLWTTKSPEIERGTHGLHVMRQALAEYGRQLDAGLLDMTRARYVDIERLSQSLKPNALENRERYAKVLFAVQFLGMNKK